MRAKMTQLRQKCPISTEAAIYAHAQFEEHWGFWFHGKKHAIEAAVKTGETVGKSARLILMILQFNLIYANLNNFSFFGYSILHDIVIITKSATEP
jgi:hypothetical protein